MRKLLQLGETFTTGEPTVQPVVLWTPSGRISRESYTSKTASEATEYIKAVQPRPGMSIALVLALGSYETYDLNQNGDGFNEFPYRPGMQPTCGCCKSPEAWVRQSQVVTQHYRSFEEHGKNYRHHLNNDPAKAVGDVLKAFWNPYMHRVELLVGLVNEKAPDLAQRIADREYPAVSMGCRIKYDVCTICGHQSPTRKTYCEHLKYSMRQVDRSGLRAGALNPDPVFFDISWVIRPADRTGYMLKKVAEYADIRSSAELGEVEDARDSKVAAIRKVADIEKMVRGLVVDHATSPVSADEGRKIKTYVQYVLPTLPSPSPMGSELEKKLLKYPLNKTLATLQAAGVHLTTEEFLKLFIGKMAPGATLPPNAGAVAQALNEPVLGMFGEFPELLDAAAQTKLLDMTTACVDPEITDTARGYIEKKAGIGAYLTRKYVPPILRAEEPPYTDMLSVADPSTGETYRTTRGAAIAAHDVEARAQLNRLLGTGALLRGAYLLSASVPGGVALSGMAALPALRNVGSPHTNYLQTNEGPAIGSRTEMVSPLEKSAEATLLPALGTAALIGALDSDYRSRMNRGEVMHDPGASIPVKLRDVAGELAYTHPLASTVAGIGGVHTALNLLKKRAHELAPEELFGKVAEILGDAFAVGCN